MNPTCYVFIAGNTPTDTSAYQTLRALTARITDELNGQELSESSRVAMNRLVEGSNQKMVYLYAGHNGRLVATVRVADFNS